MLCLRSAGASLSCCTPSFSGGRSLLCGAECGGRPYMLRSANLHTYNQSGLIAGALLACAVVPAALIGIVFLDAAIVPFVFVVALLHAICLGLPLYLYLDSDGRVTPIRAAGFGFVSELFPCRSSGSSLRPAGTFQRRSRALHGSFRIGASSGAKLC